MTYNKNKKNKKQDKIKDPSIEKLAGEILKDQIDENEEISDIPDILEEETQPIKKTEPKKEPEPEKPRPIIFSQGTRKDNAFIIVKHIREIDNILNKHFGSKNGDYFINGDNTSVIYKNGIRKKYKCVAIEDKNNFKYCLWFDISNLSFLF